MSVEVECDSCGNLTEKKPCDIKEKDYLFCSKECYYEWERNRVEVECDNCGKTFEKIPSNVGENNFCSKECHAEWFSGKNNTSWRGGKVEVECDQCGKSIKKARYEIKEYEHHFCSRECYHKWDERKVEVECENCGEIFNITQSRYSQSERFFCSGKCRKEYFRGKNHACWKGGKQTIHCDNCGKEFKRKPSLISEYNFCSPQCHSEWRSENKSGKDSPLYNRTMSDEHLEKVIKSNQEKPNNLENELIELIGANNLPYKYVGGGDLIIEGKCPDFANTNGEKKLIELFGDYWHSESDISNRKKHFAKYGYKTLFIWEHDMKNPQIVLEGIQKFEEGELSSGFTLGKLKG